MITSSNVQRFLEAFKYLIPP